MTLFAVRQYLNAELWTSGLPTGIIIPLERFEVYEAALVDFIRGFVEIHLTADEIVYVPIDGIIWEDELLPDELCKNS